MVFYARRRKHPLSLYRQKDRSIKDCSSLRAKSRAEKEIYQLAKNFQQKAKLSSKDAIHVACSCFAKSKYFLSCDDRLIKQAQKLNLEMRIMNPVEYVREVEN